MCLDYATQLELTIYTQLLRKGKSPETARWIAHRAAREASRRRREKLAASSESRRLAAEARLDSERRALELDRALVKRSTSASRGRRRAYEGVYGPVLPGKDSTATTTADRSDIS